MAHTARPLMHFLDAQILLRHSKFGCEGGVWRPASTLPCTSLFKHLVHLLQGQSLHLGHEEVGEGHGEYAERSPEEEDLGAEIGVAFLGPYKVGRDDCDDLRRQSARWYDCL